MSFENWDKFVSDTLEQLKHKTKAKRSKHESALASVEAEAEDLKHKDVRHHKKRALNVFRLSDLGENPRHHIGEPCTAQRSFTHRDLKNRTAIVLQL